MKPQIIIGPNATTTFHDRRPVRKRAIANLKYVYSVLDPADIWLHDLTLDEDAGVCTLEIDAVDPRYAQRLATKLLKRALPKSEWHFEGANTWLKGRMVTHLQFSRRKK